ncbi:TetR/AcrR family transcriptional regulator [Woodsholea maritima]|uniref:TetR/AcrR family transcriptional regulator n=1 Tax=Woodsholea maritima TaxID=240237 RepID=UPI0003793DFE|nr:TetR/AcrR family transcriptional regulator [Woodsholea maritima]
MTRDAEPGKKRQRRKDARPQEILDAAMVLWAERGFAATRLDDVAKAAGIAKGTVYLYYASKEALFEAAIQDRLVSVMREHQGLSQSFEGSSAELLTLFLNTVYARLLKTDAVTLLKVLIGEGHHFPDLVKLYREVAIETGMAAIGFIVKRAQARGELRDGMSDLDARLIIAPAIMAAIWQSVFAGEDAMDTDAFMNDHIHLIRQGLLKPDAL